MSLSWLYRFCPGLKEHLMLKTISFTIMHFSIAFTVAYLLTGDLLVGSLVAMVEPAVNTVGYIIHEQVWQRLQLKQQSGLMSA
jgi:uncharacterized membrane protein